MGRSAKFHKKPNTKKTTSSAGSAPTSQPAAKPKPVVAVAAKEQKKRAGLKAKVKTSQTKREEREGPVLGGADYVELLFGSRRRAAAEAAKLPKDPES